MTDHEYRTLLGALRLARLDTREACALTEGVQAFTDKELAQSREELKTFFWSLVTGLAVYKGELGTGEDGDCRGVYYSLCGEVKVFRQEQVSLLECVNALITLAEREHWLADFLVTSLPVWAKRPSETTPQIVGWHLSEQIEYFESDIAGARHLLREYPQFFKNKTSDKAKSANTTGGE